MLLMNKADSPFGIQIYRQGDIRLDLELSIYQQLQKQSVNLAEFIQTSKHDYREECNECILVDE